MQVWGTRCQLLTESMMARISACPPSELAFRQQLPTLVTHWGERNDTPAVLLSCGEEVKQILISQTQFLEPCGILECYWGELEYYSPGDQGGSSLEASMLPLHSLESSWKWYHLQNVADEFKHGTQRW